VTKGVKESRARTPSEKPGREWDCTVTKVELGYTRVIYEKWNKKKNSCTHALGLQENEAKYELILAPINSEKKAEAGARRGE
jgi:hypothetical protein